MLRTYVRARIHLQYTLLFDWPAIFELDRMTVN